MIVDYKKEEDKSLNLETIELSGNVNLVIDKAEKSGMIPSDGIGRSTLLYRTYAQVIE